MPRSIWDILKGEYSIYSERKRQKEDQLWSEHILPTLFDKDRLVKGLNTFDKMTVFKFLNNLKNAKNINP